MTVSKIGLTTLMVLLLVGCGRDRAAHRGGDLPIGGPAILETALRRALHGAEPDGAVLVVLWTVAAPPTSEVKDLAKRWAAHGLVALGVCVETLGGDSRDAALARLRDWQRRNNPGIPGFIYDGDATTLASAVAGAGSGPGLVLLDAQGGRLWSGDGFTDLDAVEAILQAHLGEPNVADREDGCTCGRIVSEARRAESAAGPRPRAS